MKATIYTSNEFMGNINRYEAKELMAYSTRQYAQYANIPQLQWIPMGKRKPIAIAKPGVRVYVLILEGVGHPKPEELFSGKMLADTIDVTMQEAKYSAFDERWQTDFDKLIDKYILENNVTVVADYRYTKGFNSFKES